MRTRPAASPRFHTGAASRPFSILHPLSSRPGAASYPSSILHPLSSSVLAGQRRAAITLALALATAIAAAATHKQTLVFPVTPPPVGSARPVTNQCLVTCGPVVPVAALAFSPESKILAAGGYREILLWDLENARLTRRLGAKRLDGAVQALAFSKEGGVLVAGEGRPGVSGAVRVFDAKTGQLTHSFTEPKDVVYSLALSADGQLVAAGAADDATYIWNLADKKLVTTLKEHSDWVRAVAFSPDDKLLATGGADRNLLVWSTEDWKVATRLTQPEPVSAVVFSPDSTNLIWTIAGPESKSLRGRRAEDESEEPSSQPQKKARPRQPAQTRVTDLGAAMPQGLVRSAEGNRFYVPCSDKTVKIFSGFLDERASLSGHQDWVYAVALSADGLRLASGSADGTVRLWSVADRRALATLVQLAPGADEWLILTAQGYFTTSTREALRWRTSDPAAKTGTSLDQLENTAAVKEILAGKKQEPAVQPAKPASANR